MTNHIAFIGVGNMGNPMADQLVKAGKEVKAFDVSPEVIKIAKESGLNVVSTIDKLLDGASTVISMLPEGKHVRSLYLGDKGILNKIPKECLIIDCSTIDIETSIELGGIIGGLDDSQLSILKAYGKKIGLAYQIRDDIIDIESPTFESGKPQGSDAMKKKITYPSLVGIEEAKLKSQSLAEEASNILMNLNSKSESLKSLTSYVVTRNY